MYVCILKFIYQTLFFRAILGLTTKLSQVHVSFSSFRFNSRIEWKIQRILHTPSDPTHVQSPQLSTYPVQSGMFVAFDELILTHYHRKPCFILDVIHFIGFVCYSFLAVLLLCCGAWVSLAGGAGLVVLKHGQLSCLSSLARDQTHDACIERWILKHQTTREVPGVFFVCFFISLFLN